MIETFIAILDLIGAVADLVLLAVGYLLGFRAFWNDDWPFDRRAFCAAAGAFLLVVAKT